MHSVEQLSAMIEKIKLKEESVSTPHCILKPSRINNIELQKSSILSPSIENENLPYKIPNSVLKSSMLSLSSCRRNEACPNSSEKQFVNTVNAINVPNKGSKTKNNEIISANSLTEIFLSETTCNQKRRIRPKSFVELSNYANLGLGSENKMPCCQLPVVKKSTDPHEKSLVFTALNSMPEMVRISQHSPKKSMATIREIPNQIAPENVEGTNIEARGTIDSLDDVEELMEVIEEVVIGVDEVLSDGLLEEVEVYRPPTHILGTKNYFSQKETHASKNTSEDICINNNDHTFEQNNCDMNQVVYDNMKVATQSTPNVPIDLLITNRETSSSIGKSASYSQPRTADIMKETHTTSELDLNNCVRSNDEQLKTILDSQNQAEEFFERMRKPVGSKASPDPFQISSNEKIQPSCPSLQNPELQLNMFESNKRNMLNLSKSCDVNVHTIEKSENINRTESQSSEEKTLIIEMCHTIRGAESATIVRKSQSDLFDNVEHSEKSPSVENIVNEIVKVAENLEKTEHFSQDETRESEIGHFDTDVDHCASAILGQENKNKYAEIEPDDMVLPSRTNFSNESLDQVQLNGRSVPICLEIQKQKNVENSRATSSKQCENVTLFEKALPEFLELEVITLPEDHGNVLVSEMINNITQSHHPQKSVRKEINLQEAMREEKDIVEERHIKKYFHEGSYRGREQDLQDRRKMEKNIHKVSTGEVMSAKDPHKEIKTLTDVLDENSLRTLNNEKNVENVAYIGKNMPDKVHHEKDLHKEVNHEIEMKETVNHEIELQETVNYETNLQDLVNREMELQKTVSREIELQKTVNREMELQETVNREIELQGGVNHEIELQETINHEVHSQETVNLEIELQGGVNHEIELQETINHEVHSQETVNLEIELQGGVNHEIELQETINHEVHSQETVNLEIKLQEEVNREIELQEKVNCGIELQETVNREVHSQETVNREMELQGGLNRGVELQKTINHEVHSQETVNLEIELQKTVNREIELQEKVNCGIELQKTMNREIELQETVNCEVELQEEVNCGMEMQETMNPEIELQETMNCEVELQEEVNREIELQEKVNCGIELQKTVNREVELQGGVNHEIELQETINHEVHSQETVNLEVELQEEVNREIELQEKVNCGIELQETVNREIEFQETVNREVELQETVNREIELQGGVNHEIESQEKINHKVHSQKTVNLEIELRKTVNREIKVQEKVNCGIELQETVNHEVELQETVNHEVVLQETVNREVELQGGVNHEIELQETINHEVHSQENVNSEIELRETVDREMELQGGVNHEIELQEKVNCGIELQETVNREVELQGGVNHEIELQETINHEVHSQENVNSEIELRETVDREMELQGGVNHEIELQEKVNCGIELQETKNHQVKLQETMNREIELQETVNREMELQEKVDCGIELQETMNREIELQETVNCGIELQEALEEELGKKRSKNTEKIDNISGYHHITQNSEFNLNIDHDVSEKDILLCGQTLKKISQTNCKVGDKLNVSIGLNNLQYNEQLHNILSSKQWTGTDKTSKRSNEFFRLNCSEYTTNPNSFSLNEKKSPKLDCDNLRSSGSSLDRICIKLKCDTSMVGEHTKKNGQYKSYTVQDSSITEIESSHDTTTTQNLSLLDMTKKKKGKSVDTDTIPLLTFESFDKSDDTDDDTSTDKLTNNKKDRRASTLSTPRNSVEYNSEDETVETIENFISKFPCTKESIETDSNKKVNSPMKSDHLCTNQSISNNIIISGSNVQNGKQDLINNYVNKKLKQLEDQNFKHDSLVPNLYESNFEQVYLHEDLNVESNEELKTNSETCRVIHQKDVNFNSSQYSCSISEDTVLNPLNETNVDLEESTESFASSEWNMSSDNSVPNYLSYYEYSHTVEYCTTLKLSTINDSSISMSHVPEKNTSFSSASNDSNASLDNKREEKRHSGNIERKNEHVIEPLLEKVSVSSLDNEALSTFFSNYKASNVKVAAEESQDTRSGIESNRVHNIQYCLYSPNQNDPSKTNNINKIQANYNPKTHATIIHLAKSSMLDKNRNDSTVNSQSMCSSKKNIVRKHKNSSTSDVEDNHKMLPADKESLFNLPDLKSSDLVQVDKNLSVPDNFSNIFLCDENDKIVQSDEFINTAALLGTDDKLFEESSSSEVSCNENLNQLIASLSDDTNSCDANTKKKKKKSEKSVSSTRCKQDYVSGAVIKVNECRSESNNSNSWNDKTNVPENGYNIDKNTNSRLQFDIELGIEMMDNSELRIIKSSVKSKSSNITENSSNNNMEKNIKTEVELENTQSYFPAGDVKQPLFHHREQNYQQDQLHDCQEQHYNEKQGQYHHEHLSHRQQPKQQQQHIQNHQLFDHRHQKPVIPTNYVYQQIPTNYVHQKSHQQIYNTAPNCLFIKTPSSQQHLNMREASGRMSCNPSDTNHHILVNPNSLNKPEESAVRIQSIIMKSNNQTLPLVRKSDTSQEVLPHSELTCSASEESIGPFMTDHTFATDYSRIYGTGTNDTTTPTVPYLQTSETCENMLVESNMSNVNSVIIQQDPAQNSLFHYYEPFNNTNVVKTRSDVLDIPILPANRMMSIAEVLANPDCNPELQFKLKTISSSKVNK
ncbi:hypothetical protein M8J75_005885 [Diaphorina citri]|nr:hypothetical protein M8J75_005885 [Diaphorina citri]